MGRFVKFWDLALVALVTVVAMVIVGDTLGLVVFRAAVTLPLVLIFPGYGIVTAMFPYGEHGGMADAESVRGSLVTPERVLMILVFSVAVTIGAGFVLNLAAEGLRAIPWALLLGGVTLVATVIAGLRRIGHPGPRFSHAATPLPGQSAVAFAAAGLIASSALVLGVQGAQWQHQPGFAQLWILPTRNAALNWFSVGVSNQSSGRQTFKVVIRAQHHTLYQSHWFTLASGQTLSRAVHLHVRHAGQAYVRLYRSQFASKSYRTVFVHVVRNLPKHARPAIQVATLSVQSKGANNFTVRVANRGTSSQAYLVVIRAHHHRLYHSPLFTVQPGGIRTFEVHLRVRHTGSARVRLYRSPSSHKPYKTVFVRVVQNKPTHGG